MRLSTGNSSMHTQHVKLSTYVRGGGEDVVAVDALDDALPSSSSSSFGGTGDETATTAAAVLLVVVVV